MLIGPVIYHPAETIQTGFENILTWYLPNLAVYNMLISFFKIKAAQQFVFLYVLSLVVVAVNVTVKVNNIKGVVVFCFVCSLCQWCLDKYFWITTTMRYDCVPGVVQGWCIQCVCVCMCACVIKTYLNGVVLTFDLHDLRWKTGISKYWRTRRCFFGHKLLCAHTHTHTPGTTLGPVELPRELVNNSFCLWSGSLFCQRDAWLHE